METKQLLLAIKHLVWACVVGIAIGIVLFYICLFIPTARDPEQPTVFDVFPGFCFGIVENHFVKPGIISIHDAISGFGLATIISGMTGGGVSMIGMLCYEIFLHILGHKPAKRRPQEKNAP